MLFVCVVIVVVFYLCGMCLLVFVIWDLRMYDWDCSWEMGIDLFYVGRGFECNFVDVWFGMFFFFFIVLVVVWGFVGGC